MSLKLTQTLYHFNNNIHYHQASKFEGAFQRQGVDCFFVLFCFVKENKEECHLVGGEFLIYQIDP